MEIGYEKFGIGLEPAVCFKAAARGEQGLSINKTEFADFRSPPDEFVIFSHSYRFIKSFYFFKNFPFYQNGVCR